jgi:hypothetical protein
LSGSGEKRIYTIFWPSLLQFLEGMLTLLIALIWWISRIAITVDLPIIQCNSLYLVLTHV